MTKRGEYGKLLQKRGSLSIMKIIDEKTVKHVAFLSRLSLNEKELKVYSSQLASILTYISKLNEIDTRNVPPTSHVISSLKNVYRKDVLKASLKMDEALNNAPSREGAFFKVPPIIEGK